MSEILDEIKKLNDKADEAASAVKAAQAASTACAEIKGRLDTTDTTVQTAAEASAKAIEAVQEIKSRIDSIDKTAEWMEKSISRLGSGADDGEQKALAAKARDESLAYLRSGTEMSEEVVGAMADAICTKSLLGVSKEQRALERKALIEGSNPDGGYFTRPEMAAKMIQRIFETSPVRQIATVQTTNADAVEFLLDDDEADSGGWVGETEERNNTGTPKVGKVTIPVHEQFAQPRATQKMLDDAGFDIEAWLSGKVTRKMTRVENTSFVVGDGSQKPKGFLAYAPWAAAGEYQRNAIEQINSGAAGAFTGDGLKILQNSLIEEYQAGAVWGLKRESWTGITTLKDNENRYLLDVNSLKNGDTMTLLGKRVMFMHDMPAVAADALSLVYGDFSEGYTVVDRIGFRVIRDMYTSKPYIKFYTTKRTGGDVTNYEALKIQKLAV